MPGTACWEQESSSCEERFGHASERRSRKQRMPRKIAPVVLEIPTEVQEQQQERKQEREQEQQQEQQQEKQQPESQLSQKPQWYRLRLRCFLCPKTRSARAYRRKPYHTQKSLLLHKIWMHRQGSGRNGIDNTKDKKMTPTLKLASIKASLSKTS